MKNILCKHWIKIFYIFPIWKFDKGVFIRYHRRRLLTYKKWLDSIFPLHYNQIQWQYHTDSSNDYYIYYFKSRRVVVMLWDLSEFPYYLLLQSPMWEFD